MNERGGWNSNHSGYRYHACYFPSFQLCVFHGEILCAFWNAFFENDIIFLFIDNPAIWRQLGDEVRVEVPICNSTFFVMPSNGGNKHPLFQSMRNLRSLSSLALEEDQKAPFDDTDLMSQ